MWLTLPEMDDLLRAAAAARGGLFTRADAHRAGVTDRRLAGLIRRGAVRRLRPGVYVDVGAAAAAEPRQRHLLAVAAAQHRCPSGVASHESGVLLHGGDLLRDPVRVRLTVPPGHHCIYPGLVVHAAALPAHHVSQPHGAGLAVTTVARTIVDISRALPFRAAVVAVDSLLRECTVEPDAVAAVLADCRGWPGIIRARRAVAFADGRSESPLESASRVMLHEWDVDPPELQEWLDIPGFGWVRADFYWRQQRVVGEADGRVKYVDLDDAWAEKRRQDALWEAGYRVVRWGWDGVFTTPAATVSKIRAALRNPAPRPTFAG